MTPEDVSALEEALQLERLETFRLRKEVAALKSLLAAYREREEQGQGDRFMADEAGRRIA